MSREKLKALHARWRGRFVAYARVSTPEQMDDGNSLFAQSRAIEEYAASHMRQLVQIFPDSHSGALPYEKRTSLRAAVQKAEELGCSILVTSPDRLSRNLDVLRHLNLRKTPVWVVGRGRLTRSDLERELARAADDLDQRRDAGSLSWSPAVRKRRARVGAQQLQDRGLNGRLQTQARAHQKVARIVEVLETHSEARSMTRRQLVRLLNELGVLNDKVHDATKRVLWTFDTLQRPLRKAREAIEANSEPLEVGFFPVVNPDEMEATV